jgi:hypothetical protein
MTHRADEVVADALGEGAVRQEEGGSAAVLVCRRRKKKTGQQDPELETAAVAVADKMFDETCQPEERQRRPGRGKKKRRDRELTLVADGVVPEGAGALVLGALQVALPGGGGVLELLVAVIAVVFPQRHPLGNSPLGALSLLISCCLQAMLLQLQQQILLKNLQDTKISFANPKPTEP